MPTIANLLTSFNFFNPMISDLWDFRGPLSAAAATTLNA
jgi:hypothetical protein